MRSQKSRLVGGAALLVAMAAFTAQASAYRHLALVRSEPAEDTIVTVAPTAIRLFYTQAPTLTGTRVRLTDAQGTVVALGAVKADEADAKILSAPLTGTLSAGVHTVTWRALSTDGHIVEGTFDFTFRPAH